MLDAAYVRQRVADLRFAIYGRPLDADAFTILRQRSIARPRYTAELWIIGSSHALSVRAGDHVVAEVLTGAAAPLPRAGRLDFWERLGIMLAASRMVGPLHHDVQLHRKVCSSEEEFLRKESQICTDEQPE